MTAVSDKASAGEARTAMQRIRDPLAKMLREKRGHIRAQKPQPTETHELLLLPSFSGSPEPPSGRRLDYLPISYTSNSNISAGWM